MFVILCYDVAAKHAARIRKTAKKYLQSVQRSVFEGFLTEAQLRRLQTELQHAVDVTKDAVVFYIIENGKQIRKDSLGAVNESAHDIL